jgi:hypothetical protein
LTMNSIGDQAFLEAIREELFCATGDNVLGVENVFD